MNQTQSPVVTVYQPLLALVKQIQWSLPDQYQSFVFILGGLHLEMTILKMIGQILHRRTTAIEDSGVASSGTGFVTRQKCNKVKKSSTNHSVCSIQAIKRPK